MSDVKAKERIKVLLDIQDNKQDPVLDIIISNVEQHLLNKIGEDQVPEKLQFVVTEIAIKRFNRIGSEGYQSESVEGHSVNFNDNDFKPYEDVIREYKGTGRGRVRFI